jgi:hypothetical protein
MDDAVMTDEGDATPLWVKVFGVVAIVVIIGLVVLVVVGGDHGPGRHGVASAHLDSPALRSSAA